MDKSHDTDNSDVKQARQRASVKWILSKAFNNRVPENQREPFYRDHEGQDHLKPQIVVGLGNASIYCQTLSNLYSDPNYQSLNHWSILQTLTRKGVPMTENPDMPLTETVLIQTNPLRINAHMSVIEALMILYAKEVASCERISAAINRITGGSLPKEVTHHETALLCWLSHVCAALKRRIDNEIENGATDEHGVRLQSPNLPLVRDYIDLCDGVSLAYLISYYCPNIVPWTSVRLNYMPTVEDSIYNILLVSNFSQKHLPYSVFHMTPQDVTYMRGSMKQNLVVLLADLFNLFEIHPAKCVAYPGMDQQISMDRSSSAASVRRITSPRDDQNMGLDDGFVVHRGRTIPTLASMQEPLPAARSRQSKDRSAADTKTDDRGDSIAAGRPSNWEETRRPSFAGRRSRRNSVSDDSQLTIENFGGSQDQLNMIGRSFEREKTFTNIVHEPAVPVRSSMADARGSILFDYDDTVPNTEKQDHETEKQPPVPMRRKSQTTEHSHSKDILDNDVIVPQQQSGNASIVSDDGAQSIRKTSFATLPNTTTWQQQSVNYQKIDHPIDPDDRPSVDAYKLSTVRMKLEEKRRQIEQDKRKLEANLNRHQQKVGKAAFLQAINKESADLNTIETKWASVESKQTPDLDKMNIEQYQVSHSGPSIKKSLAQKNESLQDLHEDISRLATLESQMQAQHIQAQQLMQAQQIANMIYGSQQHIPNAAANHRSPMSQTNFGSSPHISQPHSPQQPIHFNNVRPMSRDASSHQYINDQGQYIAPMSNNHQSYSSYIDNENGSGGMYPYEQTHQQSINPYHTYRIDQYQNSPMQQQQPPQPQQRIQQSQPNQFYLHENTLPQPAARRTWAQPAPPLNTDIPQQQHHQQSQMLPLDINAWSQNSPKIDTHTWKSSNAKNPGFMLHQNNGGIQQHQHDQFFSSPVSSSGSESRATSIHHNSNGNNDYRDNRVPISSPAVDEMAPQSISFIGDEDSVDLITEHPPPSRAKHSNRPNVIQHEQDLDLGKLNISSGKLTYRIPSPTRPSLNKNSFQKPNDEINNEQKGFYISFDNSQPKRPKPPLRTKRSPKKERSLDVTDKQEQISQLEHELNNERSQVNKRQNSFSSFENKLRSPYGQAYESNESNGRSNIDSEPIIARKHVSDSQMMSVLDRRHLEDVTNHQQEPQQQIPSPQNMLNRSRDANKALIIDDALTKLDPESVDEMERKKEKIMLLSLQRRQQQEEAKARKEIEAMQRREKEREKEDERVRKREEQAARRAAILEQHKLKKAIEEAEQKGITLDRNDLMSLKQQHALLSQANSGASSGAATKMRTQKVIRPRPKTIHVETGSVDLSEASSLSSRNKKGSNSNLTGIGQLSSSSMRRDYYRGSQDSLAVRESPDEYHSTSSTPIGRRGSYKTSRDPAPSERGRTISRISVAKGSNLNFRGRKSNSLMNLCDTDSGLGRATPPRRAPSPGMGQSNRHLPSPSGPGSLPPGFMKRGRVFDDGSSDISSTPSSMLEYSGPKLYKQPTTKSNRGIILNAVEYCVFPGVVNRDAKQKVLDKINRSDAKHFLILFRDAGCQFRALYSYWPENESVLKLYGTGPSQVDEFMFDKFFKYNSGGKCFSQIHTKHLTVTIDAFTIHNSLWQGKKVNLPSKKDMALVI